MATSPTPSSTESNSLPAEDVNAEGTKEDSGSRWAYGPHALGLAVAIFAFDQWTKLLTLEHLSKPDLLGRYPAVEVIPNFLRFIYAENRGAAFSILYGHVELLAAFSIVAIVFLVFFFRSLSSSEVASRIALGMILGGAIGNLYDRVFRGFVVDMIDAYVGQHHWPTFNVADSFVCIGIVILMTQMLRGKI